MHFNFKKKRRKQLIYVFLKNVLSFKQGSFKVHCWNNYSKWYQLATSHSPGTLQMHWTNHMNSDIWEGTNIWEGTELKILHVTFTLPEQFQITVIQ